MKYKYEEKILFLKAVKCTFNNITVLITLMDYQVMKIISYEKTVYVAGFDRQVGFDKTAEPLRIFLSLYLSIHNNETKNQLMIN